MRTFYEFLGEVLHAGPCEAIERLTSWIIGLMGAGILALMAYGWVAARW
jgi:hypothetical protein